MLPGTMMLVTGLNLTLARQLPTDVQARLRGRALRMCVTDASWTFDFVWNGSRFVPQRTSATPDLTISAQAYDFLLLARREEDPDSLFFNRRLAMEGDTELGLIVKNSLDALESPLNGWQDWKPDAVLARLKTRLAPR
jgi:predicted lipid carrier protein YhbT